MRSTTARLSASILTLFSLALVACDDDYTGAVEPLDPSEQTEDPSDETPSKPKPPPDDPTPPDDPPTDDGGDDVVTPTPPSPPPPSSEVANVCRQWNSARADLSEGSWSGSTNTCSAGDIAGSGRSNALKLVNLYRSLADLPAVTTDATRNKDAQACALIMDAGNRITHTPSTSTPCYNSAGAAAAGKSNVATTGAVRAVDLYMLDPGSNNAATLGHRRYILSNRLGPIGIGSTGDYSCMWVLGGAGSAGRDWTAWPAEGVFPVHAMTAGGSTSLDSTGWSIQSDSIDLSKATVKVTSGGASLPVSKRTLSANYGSKYGLSFVPSGWKATAGKTYRVSVSGVPKPFSYDVQMVDCAGY